MSETGPRTTFGISQTVASMRTAAGTFGDWVRQPARIRASISSAWTWMSSNPGPSLAVGLGFAVLVLSANSFLRTRDSGPLLVAAVQQGPFEVRIVESGTLEALRSVTYSSAIPGSQAKILELVPEGTHVEIGDVLVSFDPQPFADELEQTKAQLAQAQAELVKAQQEVQLLQIAAKEDVTESRDKVRLAELELESVTKGKGKLAEAESAAQLAQARRELEKAEANFEDLKPFLEEGFITKLELDRAKQAVQKAKEDVELLEIKHRTYMDYTRPAEMETSRAAVSHSNESLRQTARAAAFRLSQAEASLDLARSKHAELTGKIEQQSQNLMQCQIRATVSGMVIYKEVFFGSEKRKVQVGDQVWPNQPLIVIPDLSQMTVQTQVRETDIYKVEKNQQVIIAADAYPELRLTGEVNFIGTLAQEDQARRGGKYFTVTILVSDADSRLRPGMTARVELLVDRLQNVLYAPLEAVFERGGKHFVYVSDRGRSEVREVLVGPSNEDHVVIETGLAAGERVLLRDPNDVGSPLGGEGVPGFLDVLEPTTDADSIRP